MKSNKRFYTYSYAWQILSYYVTFIHYLFYKKIIIEGKDNIPKDCPILYAPNHQNALMDPLAIYYATGKQIVFMTRGDIFNNPILKRIFTWLKILPVFRIRDGKASLKSNDKTFDIAVEVLLNGGQVGIFPEAQHTNKRRLLPLKKGIQRVAFRAMELAESDFDIKIIPTGIYFSEYDKMDSILHIKFGEAISVKVYKDIYNESPQKAMLALRDEIEKRIKPLIINIEDAELYNNYEILRKVFAKQMAEKKYNRKIDHKIVFETSQQLISSLDKFKNSYPDKSDYLHKLTYQFKEIAKRLKIKKLNQIGQQKSLLGLIMNSMVLIMLLPLFLYGFINNIPAYFIPKKIVSKIRDKQFHSSVKFVFSLFVTPLLYLIQITVFALFVSNIWIIFAYALSLPLSGLAARKIYVHFIDLIQGFKIYNLKNSEDYSKLKAIYKEISEILDKLD
jgi:1-acyl-sn-glycerol-3-phosphate acyltransferase